ncbi:hypothetical protein ACU686_42995 [Yinghuangia aomiensis]
MAAATLVGVAGCSDSSCPPVRPAADDASADQRYEHGQHVPGGEFGGPGQVQRLGERAALHRVAFSEGREHSDGRGHLADEFVGDRRGRHPARQPYKELPAKRFLQRAQPVR